MSIHLTQVPSPERNEVGTTGEQMYKEESRPQRGVAEGGGGEVHSCPTRKGTKAPKTRPVAPIDVCVCVCAI